jgi:fatty acid/phospholipid biosynthesis enzyme
MGDQKMRRKLKLVKGQQPRGALVYGMRIFAAETVVAVEAAKVSLTDGTSGNITMHLIEGTRAQIRHQLLHSVEAFFELLDEEPSKP